MDGRGRARLGDGEEETSQSCQTALYSVKRFLSSRRAGPAPLVASRRKRTRQAKDHKVQRTRRKTKEDKKEKSLDWVGSSPVARRSIVISVEMACRLLLIRPVCLPSSS